MSLLELQALDADDASTRRERGGRNPVQSEISVTLCNNDDSTISLLICA